MLVRLLPATCRQCGLRAPDSVEGKRRLDLHMDWHFRTNKRVRELEGEGRGNARAWFVGVDVRALSPSIRPFSDVCRLTLRILVGG